jgi:hypothetical protein
MFCHAAGTQTDIRYLFYSSNRQEQVIKLCMWASRPVPPRSEVAEALYNQRRPFVACIQQRILCRCRESRYELEREITMDKQQDIGSKKKSAHARSIYTEVQ